MATIRTHIVPHLWFDREAKQAAEFYTSIFPESRILGTTTLHETPSGSVDVVRFELFGQEFQAIGAGPFAPFNEAISFMVRCDSQGEIDAYWDALTRDGGKEVQCGWVKDRFGLSWQVVPSVLDTMMRDGDAEQLARVTAAFLAMKKFDIEALERAYHGRSA